MNRDPKVIIDEIKETEQTIEQKEEELVLLKGKLTKLNIELAERNQP